MILFIFMFCMIFGPLLDIGIGLFSDTIVFTSLILILYVLIYKKRKVNGEIKKYIHMFLVVLVYSAITFLLFDISYPIDDIRVLLRPIRLIITFLGIYSLVLMYIDRYNASYMHIIKQHLYYALFIHAAIMVYQFLNPEFRNFIYGFTFAKYVLESNQMYRMAGLSGGGGAMISVFESMGLLILPFLIKQEKSFLRKIMLFAMGIVILTSIIFSGRSGIVSFVLFLPVIGLYFFMQSGAIKRLKYLIVSFVSIMIFVSSLVWVYQNQLDDIDPYALRAFERTFETVINYEQSGEVEDDTVNTLKNMILLPEDLIHFLFGQLHYLGGYRGVDSDIGFIRYIYGYGVLGSLLNYMFYIYAIFYLYKNKNAYKDFAFLTSLLLFVIMFFQMKEIFVLTKTGFSITSIMLISFILYIKTEGGRYGYGGYYKNNN